MRTSSNGNDYWVEGHWVERNDWDRISIYSLPSTFSYDLPKRFQKGEISCFSNPNAKCPVCRQPVFFYQNEAGSRVFFDHPGPPWPKHPCTEKVNIKPYLQLVPIFENDDDQRRHKPISEAGTEIGQPQFQVQREERWKAMIVERRTDREGVHWVRARPSQNGSGRAFRFTLEQVDDFPKIGEVFYLLDDQASFFSFAQFRPIQVKIIIQVRNGKRSKSQRKSAFRRSYKKGL